MSIVYSTRTAILFQTTRKCRSFHVVFHSCKENLVSELALFCQKLRPQKQLIQPDSQSCYRNGTALNLERLQVVGRQSHNRREGYYDLNPGDAQVSFGLMEWGCSGYFG